MPCTGRSGRFSARRRSRRRSSRSRSRRLRKSRLQNLGFEPRSISASLASARSATRSSRRSRSRSRVRSYRRKARRSFGRGFTKARRQYLSELARKRPRDRYGRFLPMRGRSASRRSGSRLSVRRRSRSQ